MPLLLQPLNISNGNAKTANSKCCFQGCTVDTRSYLISGHIVRWADEEHTRGETSNGLCLCVFHDKAFEIGEFALDDDYKVIGRNKTSMYEKHIAPFIGHKIKTGEILPCRESLKKHERHNFIDSTGSH